MSIYMAMVITLLLYVAFLQGKYMYEKRRPRKKPASTEPCVKCKHCFLPHLYINHRCAHPEVMATCVVTGERESGLCKTEREQGCKGRLFEAKQEEAK